MTFTRGAVLGCCAYSRLYSARGVGNPCSQHLLSPSGRVLGLQQRLHAPRSAVVASGSCCSHSSTGQKHTQKVTNKKHRCLSTDSNSDSFAAPINKQYGGTVMTEQLYNYLVQHTREPEVLRWLRDETARQFPVGARMQVSPEQAQFMAWLVQTTGACKALELGVFTGYSALAVAMALPEHGKLVACDRDPRALELAQTAFARADVAHKVEVRQGLALDIIQSLLQQHTEAGSFDFAFIDADKRAYSNYFELCMKLLRPGGILALDNVLWYGKVADSQEQDKKTLALRQLNTDLLHDERIRLSIVPIGDGMALCTKL